MFRDIALLGLAVIFLSKIGATPTPQPRTDDASYGIQSLGTFSLRPGLENSTVDTSTNTNDTSLTGPDIHSDTWEITDTGLTLKMDVSRSIGLIAKDAKDILEGAKAQVLQVWGNELDTKVEDTFYFDLAQRRNTVKFHIEPTVSAVLTWQDVLTCIHGLETYAKFRNTWTKIDYGLEEPKAGGRGRFGQGSLEPLKRTPPPT